MGVQGNRKYSLDFNFFDKIDTEEKAYILGFLTADGYVEPYNNSVVICQATKDGALVERIAAELQYTGPVRREKHDSNFGTGFGFVRIDIQSVQLVRALAKLDLGLIGRKSHTVRPWSGPPELMRHYWRGAFDGDGCITHDNQGNWFMDFAGSEPVVRAFESHVKGFCPTRGTTRPHSSIWRFDVGGKGLPHMVASNLYKDARISLERKRVLADQVIGDFNIWSTQYRSNGVGRPIPLKKAA